ncbi:hypothetical protein BP5796_08692 [Coleophoma crateriformis]|uniref:Pumilio homology domain family member 3 n=1 Tax=Coleophoma crateriformis TaxID=565419 RepID=A0A3D8R8C2_9HELO|nr:hypothetical protein BP5796_08692 [Coleophoma crateriformis]
MTTTNRPAAAMASRHNSDDRTSQISTIGQTFGNGASWQASSGIWGSGFGNSKRDASRTRGMFVGLNTTLAVTDGLSAAESDSYPAGPSGSSALTASSEADPWTGRTNGPWNQPDTTSPTLHSSGSGSTSPTRVRNPMSGPSQQTLLELQTSYHNSRPAIGQGKSFSRPQPKSSLDPSTGSFDFARKPSFGFNDDKENFGQDSAYDGDASRKYRLDQIGSQGSNYLAINGAASRDGSLPPSRASDSGLTFGNHPTFGSFGHTPASSIHSQRPSYSGASGSFSQTNGSRFNDISTQGPDSDVRDKLAELRFRETDTAVGAQSNSNFEQQYSPTQTNFNNQSFQSNGGAMWNEAAKSFNPYAQEYNPTLADQSYIARAQRFGERGSASPAASEYRRGLDSPKYYSTVGTPAEQLYRPSSQGPRIPQGPNDLDQRLQALHLVQQQAYMFASGYQGQFSGGYEYTPQNFRPMPLPYGYPMPVNFPPAPTIPTRPAKDNDVGAGVRSILLEEFRANLKGNKRFELKDIYNHVVEFSGDQHGSRFIQQKLETANSDEKEQLFREIQPNALQLMTDVFGNYVIQKMFEHGNQVQKRLLAEQMRNHVNELSLQMYGCRVVQKALEHVLADQQAELVKELQPDILRCVKDQNGNHVVQKAIERVPREHIQFIIEAFKGQVHLLAAHPYGCRVVQRILEYCTPADQASILEEFHECSSMLITDQYGNYVTQHVISKGQTEDRAKVIKIVIAQILPLSKHKFASNVVEKSIEHGTYEQRKAILDQVTALHSDGTSPLTLIMKDQFGNYVIQKLLASLEGADRERLIEELKPQLSALKKYNFGKQITAMEKLVYGGSAPPPPTSPLTSQATASMQQPAALTPQTQPIEIESVAATPSLTMGQNSPQSSSLPSASVSTVDEPTGNDQNFKSAEKECPEVVIHGV